MSIDKTLVIYGLVTLLQKSPFFLNGVVGWCDGLGKLPVPGRPTIWIIVGQGPTALAVGAGGVVWTFFSLDYRFSFLIPSLGDVGWLVGFGFNGPLRQYFSLYRAISQREGEKEEKG